jgi:gamma-glutamylcysteine synthetase
MKVKYQPIKSAYDTAFIFGKDSITIDGIEYTFDAASVSWPDINRQTDGAILEAHREKGELYITVLRRYTGGWESWYTPEYVEVGE